MKNNLQTEGSSSNNNHSKKVITKNDNKGRELIICISNKILNEKR